MLKCIKEKKIIKKTLAIVLSGLMAVAALTGCSSGTTETTAAAAETTEAADNAEGTETEKDAAKEASSTEVSGTVSTDGSTSMEKVIGALGESFMAANKGVTFTYNPTGSGSGIQAVQEGRCDIGLSSRALKDDELASGLKEDTLCLDGIAIIVNNENTVEDISLDDLAAIYKGEITNWSELGGADSEIVLIGREAGSGTRDGFESITDTKDSCQYRQELTSTGDVITTVSQNPAAIGYASLAAVKDSVKAIKIDGVEASEATVMDGSYKIQRPFVLVTKEGEKLSDAAQAFYDYAMSSDANELITQAGAVAIN